MYVRFVIAFLAVAVAATVWAQAPLGTVSGFVLDGQTGRPIIGAAVEIDGQGSKKNVSDSSGHFSLPLSPGTYTLRLSADNYAPVELTNITVAAGKDTEASAILSNRAVVTTMEVVERIDAVASTAEAMLNERKLSAVVSDSISREELASSAAGDAAGALEKVTGVSVVGDGFVYVRGLGERYSATQLNGAMVPTTEPEKRVVPLDLFPAGMIDSIKIAKTYSPDLPAEFSGGLVQLKTIEFPVKRLLEFSIKTGYNTVTTNRRFLSYPGGPDFWGFGKGARGLPSAIPIDARIFQGQFSPAQLQAFGQAFSNNWEPAANASQRPAFDWSAVAGGTFGRVGLMSAFSFSNKPQVQSELQRYIRQGAGSPLIFTEYKDYRDYSESARLGGVFNAALRLTPTQRILFKNTFTHDSEKTAREFSGYDGGVDGNISSQRLRYVERLLFSTGVEADHPMPKLWNSVFHWQVNYSNSRRDEPDLREVIRNQLPNGTYSFSASGSSGLRFFTNLNDKIYEPQADWSVPFFHGKVSGLFKMGTRITVRRRDFGARRFLFAPQQLTTLNLMLPSNQLFAPGNIRPSGFQLTEFTRATDSYAASMNIFAGYAMVDINLSARWRVEGGIRVEDADQRVTTFDNRVPNAKPVLAGLANRDPAPAVNVIYSLGKRQNLRGSVSRTLSRPDFRELSPFDFNNVLGGFVVTGNPNLVRATVSNYDFRWEMFPGGNQLIAASFFAKKFTNPIEQTIVPSNDLRQTFVNAQGARNLGLELEFRQGLGQFTKKLKEFGISSNQAFVDSNITIKPEDATIVTSQSRALLGQSRYIANAILEWRRPRWHSGAKFFANHVSRRVSDVGTFRVPDIYQEGNTFLEFVYTYTFDEKNRWSLRVEGENLGNNDFRWTQGPFVQRNYKLGRTFQVGLRYSVF